jgi:hypothetical protein
MIKFQTLSLFKMQIISETYSVIDWDPVQLTKHSGETGFALTGMFETENVQSRLAEYSPGFRSAHGCCRGYLIHLLDGALNFELTCRLLNDSNSSITCNKCNE